MLNAHELIFIPILEGKKNCLKKKDRARDSPHPLPYLRDWEISLKTRKNIYQRF